MRRIIVLSLLFYSVYCMAQTPTACTQSTPCVQECYFGPTSRTCTWVSASAFKGPKGDSGTPGTNGTNGKDGAPGAQGPPGPAIPGLTFLVNPDGTTSLKLNGQFSTTGTSAPSIIIGPYTCAPNSNGLFLCKLGATQ